MRSFDERGASNYMIPIALVVVVALVVVILRQRAVKKKRNDY